MHAHRLAIQPSRGTETRRDLLKGAKALFLLKGLATVTVDAICLAANVSKGGFYHHFPDKESAFLVVASEELTREMEFSTDPASSNTPAGHGAGALLVDLWAWVPRHPRACRRVRAVHRRALRQLSKLPSQAACGTSLTGDQEARAALALLVGIGQVVQRTMARYPTASERTHEKAAAG
jgi:AcrR family transcriptional regulator